MAHKQKQKGKTDTLTNNNKYAHTATRQPRTHTSGYLQIGGFFVVVIVVAIKLVVLFSLLLPFVVLCRFLCLCLCCAFFSWFSFIVGGARCQAACLFGAHWRPFGCQASRQDCCFACLCPLCLLALIVPIVLGNVYRNTKQKNKKKHVVAWKLLVYLYTIAGIYDCIVLVCWKSEPQGVFNKNKR